MIEESEDGCRTMSIMNISKSYYYGKLHFNSFETDSLKGVLPIVDFIRANKNGIDGAMLKSGQPRSSYCPRLSLCCIRKIQIIYKYNNLSASRRIFSDIYNHTQQKEKSLSLLLSLYIISQVFIWVFSRWNSRDLRAQLIMTLRI